MIMMAFTDKIKATPQNLGQIPKRAGVYKLYDGSEIIYIGRSSGGNNTIYHRINNHHAGNSGPCTRGFSHYAYDTTVADVTTERNLLQEYRRRNGRLPRCNDKMP